MFKFQDETLLENYSNGFDLLKLFPVNVGGFTTHRDNFAIDFSKIEIKKRALSLIDNQIDDLTIQKLFDISDNRDWQINKARIEIQKDSNWESKIIECNYRPFDNRSCYFSSVMMDYPRKELIQHSFKKENLLLGIGRQGLAVGDIEWCLTTVSKNPADANMFRRGGVNLFPLYLYPETTTQLTTEATASRTPNLNMEIVTPIAAKLGLAFVPEKVLTGLKNLSGKDNATTFAPIDLLDYIYAVLHSPTYREKYKEFLKIDFPKIPYPKDTKTFWELVALGSQIREIHLLESPTVEQYITQFNIDGDCVVGKPRFVKVPNETTFVKVPNFVKGETGNVFINETQYFENVPEVAWNFYIGGYQPAQKWLKDRKARKLEFEDIAHYQKIIVALTETDRLMKAIDCIDIE